MNSAYRLNFKSALFLALILAGLISFGYIGVSRDWPNYVRIFYQIDQVPDIWTLRYEPLFSVYVKLVSIINSSPEFIYFLVIAPALLMKANAVRILKGDCLLFFFIYGALWASTFEFNQIRTAVAIGFIYTAISISERRRILAIVVAALAIGFHYSTAVFLPFIFTIILLNSGMKKSQRFIAFVFVIIVGYFAYLTITGNFLSYALDMAEQRSSEGDRLFSLFSLYVILCTGVIAFFTFGRGLRNTPQAILIILLAACVGIIIFFIQIATGAAYAYRILETTTSLIPLGLAWEWSNAKNQSRRMVLLALVVLAVAQTPNYWESGFAY